MWSLGASFLASVYANTLTDGSRSGNCRLGLYCDASEKKCMTQKDDGQSCTADKEYVTLYCQYVAV